MTLTSDYPLTIDGVRLDTLAFNISTYGGRRSLSAKRLGSVEIPRVHGLIPSLVANTYEQAEVILSMWVRGATTDGYIPLDKTSRALVDRNLDMIFRLFGNPDKLIELKQKISDGYRVAKGRVSDQIAPDISSGASTIKAEFKVAIELPYVFWEDENFSTWDSGTSDISPITAVVPTLTGGTAPIEDGRFLVHGPITNPRLACPETGQWIKLNGTVEAGKVWRISSDNWGSEIGAAAMSFDGISEADVTASTEYGGPSARYMLLQPTLGDYGNGQTVDYSTANYPATMEANRTVSLSLSGTDGVAGSTKFSVRAKRKFF